ncbi:MAG: hypothetical protein LDL27_05310 [Desulfovibrio sp.]|nr:hypothetical protein [Desulfovibrio sp.]
MRVGIPVIRMISLFLGVVVMAGTLFWAGWSFSENIARISQGEQRPDDGEAARAWSDTLA